MTCALLVQSRFTFWNHSAAREIAGAKLRGIAAEKEAVRAGEWQAWHALLPTGSALDR